MYVHKVIILKSLTKMIGLHTSFQVW